MFLFAPDDYKLITGVFLAVVVIYVLTGHC